MHYKSIEPNAAIMRQCENQDATILQYLMLQLGNQDATLSIKN